MSDGRCRYWIGSDTNGRVCGAATVTTLCERHYAIELRRATKALEKQRDRSGRAEAAWRERNAHKVPGWRVQLERAQAEYARRTTSRVNDRAAVGGAMHPSIVRAQHGTLSDGNVSRVVELDKIIARLTADIARAKAPLEDVS